MDLDSMEGLNEMRASVYRAAMKLVSLQKLCHMDVVSVRHITMAVNSITEVQQQQQDVGLNMEEVSQTLTWMFGSVGHVTVAAPEEICSLMFRLYDRNQTGRVSATSLQTALIALSTDNLLDKYRALVSVLENSSGLVSRSGLRSLLQDLSQVPAAVQEEVVFGSVEAAVRSCFNGVLTPTVSKEHMLSWLQSNPRLLLWLPTLYRLAVSQNISHTVRCHTCKTFPITGLRYRCIKCVNVHVCQSCFLTNRQTRKHKTHHPVLEFCTQPTWRESLSSIVHSARYALLPWRHTQREVDRRRVLMWLEQGESQKSGPPPSNVSTQLAYSVVCHSPTSDRDVSQDASVRSPPSSSKALQTDKEIPTQQADQAALLNDVRNLHRDKWLLEQELQVWRLAVQSEHGLLEDRCSEMEVTMEALRQHHLHLQGMLTQALNKMEAQQHAKNMPHSVETETQQHATNMPHSVDEEAQQQSDNMPHSADTRHTEKGNTMPTSDIHGNTEEEDDEEDQQQTPSSTIQWGTPPSHGLQYEEESAGERCLCHPVGKEDRPEVAGLQGEDTCLSEEEEENFWMCGPEKLLKETIDRLKTVMETDRWRETQKGEKKRAELQEAADQVGDSIHHLVDAVRTNTL